MRLTTLLLFLNLLRPISHLQNKTVAMGRRFYICFVRILCSFETNSVNLSMEVLLSLLPTL
jgi:hypothetical protein